MGTGHPVEAMVFDLDGTLVQTETLKAESYRRVLARLTPAAADPDAVAAAYARVVGRSGEEVNLAMIRAFDLPDGFERTLGAEPGEAPWETLYRVRRATYEEILERDADTLRAAACPYALEVLAWAQARTLPRALATMSRRPQVARVLDVLGLERAFDAVLTRDDVTNGKPDPEIYTRTFAQLGVAPQDALILEDSASGATAALAAGARVLVVVNDVTRAAVHAAGLEGRVEAVVEASPALLPAVTRLVAGATP